MKVCTALVTQYELSAGALARGPHGTAALLGLLCSIRLVLR